MPASVRSVSPITALVWAAAAWAAWQGAVFAWNGETRYRAEAAWFVFAAVLLIAGTNALRSNAGPTAGAVDGALSRRQRLLAAAALVLFSMAVYGRTLSIGLLSDDFVLLAFAERLTLVDTGWTFIRPLPLLLWWAAAPAGAAALHALNIVLHGFNAWLVFRVAVRLQLDTRAALLVGAVFATWPTQVETVAWASGVFDVLVTFFVLLATLNALDDSRPARTRAVRGIALAIAAIACKETAAALPLLLMTLMPLVSASTRRDVLRVAAATAAVVVTYLAVRAAAGLSLPVQEFPSGYQLKEMLSRPFGAMGLNLHADAAALIPVLPLIMAIEWPVMLAWIAASWPRDARSFHFVWSAAAWLLVSVLPLLTMFFVGADLQQSRYLYLGSTMWSLGMVAAATRRPAHDRRSIVALALAILVVLNTGLVIMQQQRWIEAAAVRDQVVRAFIDQAITCDPRKVTGLPDHLAGAYVFRNGFGEAIERTLPGRQWAGCEAHWDGSRFVVPRLIARLSAERSALSRE
jgi:hypothetical protein